MVGFLIWGIFILIYIALKIPSIIYSILLQGKGWNILSRFNGYWYKSALSLDRYMNYDLKSLLNLMFIKKNTKYFFGNFEDTISYVLGVNQNNKDLTILGAILVRVLWIFCPLKYWKVGHCQWAIITKN